MMKTKSIHGIHKIWNFQKHNEDAHIDYTKVIILISVERPTKKFTIFYTIFNSLLITFANTFVISENTMLIVVNLFQIRTRRVAGVGRQVCLRRERQSQQCETLLGANHNLPHQRPCPCPTQGHPNRSGCQR